MIQYLIIFMQTAVADKKNFNSLPVPFYIAFVTIFSERNILDFSVTVLIYSSRCVFLMLQQAVLLTNLSKQGANHIVCSICLFQSIMHINTVPILSSIAWRFLSEGFSHIGPRTCFHDDGQLCAVVPYIIESMRINRNYFVVGFEIVTAASSKTGVFWVVAW